MQTEQFQVRGMTCEHCEASVREELGELPGVTEVTADHTTGQVRIASAAPLREGDVRRAVETAGYALAARE